MSGEELAERLKGRSDEELRGMLETGLKEYTEEALAAARAELARRGKTGEARADAHAPSATARPIVEPAQAPKPGPWGTILVVLGAFFIYAMTLFGVLAVVRSNLHLRVGTEQIFQVLVYAVIAFVCLRAGSRQRKGWGVLLGVCLLIFAGLAFVSLTSLAAQKPGSLMPKVIAPTVVILAAGGIFSLIVALVRRSYSKERPEDRP